MHLYIAGDRFPAGCQITSGTGQSLDYELQVSELKNFITAPEGKLIMGSSRRNVQPHGKLRWKEIVAQLRIILNIDGSKQPGEILEGVETHFNKPMVHRLMPYLGVNHNHIIQQRDFLLSKLGSLLFLHVAPVCTETNGISPQCLKSSKCL